jgi:hypothetical protein
VTRISDGRRGVNPANQRLASALKPAPAHQVRQCASRPTPPWAGESSKDGDDRLRLYEIDSTDRPYTHSYTQGDFPALAGKESPAVCGAFFGTRQDSNRIVCQPVANA